MAKREYIILAFGPNEQHMLGRFVCQPVDAKTYQPIDIAFYNGYFAEIYFDPELLDYILVVDDEEVCLDTEH